MPATLSPPPAKDRRQSLRTLPDHQLPPVELPTQPKSKTEADKEALLDAFDKKQLHWGNIDWTVVVFLVVMHAGCLAAPFFFSWWAVGVAAVLYWATASIGVCLGYHRYLAHRSMKLAKPVEFATMALGTISGEGTPLMWSAVHRMHHQLSDQEGDPHSPNEGTFWSHLLWLFIYRSPKANEILFRKYCPEMLDRPMMRFFERAQPWLLIGTAAVLGTAGWFVGGWFGVMSFLLWGMCVRMVATYHATWFVNSATHLWGYRNYKTRDKSKNLWWVALFAFGEGWHNNHHAHPTVAPAGHRWWEIDITWWAIKALRFCGLAWDVNDRIPERDANAEQPG